MLHLFHTLLLPTTHAQNSSWPAPIRLGSQLSRQTVQQLQVKCSPNKLLNSSAFMLPSLAQAMPCPPHQPW
jgi:hypothetical protein